MFVYTLVDRGDGGIWLDEAARVLAGEVLYRDVFEFVGPGIVYLNAAALALFGDRVETVGLLAVAVGVAVVLAVHALAAALLPAVWRLGPPVAVGVLVYAAYGLGNHKWPALAFGVWALAVLVRGDARRGTTSAAAGAPWNSKCAKSSGANLRTLL